MKIYLYFFLFLFTKIYSQKINGFICDSISRKPIDLATISNKNIKYTSDLYGYFEIDSQKSDTLIISHIGYQNKKLLVKNFISNSNIFLNSSTEILSEVIIRNKKKKFSSPRPIHKNKNSDYFLGFQFETENCVFFENIYKEKTIISSIIFDLEKVSKKNRSNPAWKLDYFASIKINLYEFDIVNKKPGKKINLNEIITDPKYKNYKIEIDMNDYCIEIPKNGICVSVALINTKYKNPKKVFAVITPSFGFFKNREFKNNFSWIKYCNEDWHLNSISNDKLGRFIETLNVNLKIKNEENEIID